MTGYEPPSSILIVGSGAFGLSTALALSERPLFAKTQITLLDRATFPARDATSIDTSRIIRPDYSDPAYAAFAAEAQTCWRGEWGADGRYDESGLVLTAEKGGEEYVRKSYDNVRGLVGGGKVRELRSREEIKGVMAGTGGGGSGDWGYINMGSGWADAEAALRYARQKVSAKGRVEFRTGLVEKLLMRGVGDVEGVRLRSGESVRADLTVLATGAWTQRLIDLRGRMQATGQVLAYMDLTEEEQMRLSTIPVSLNLSTGMFIMPPRNRELKIARHGYGYCNPQRMPHPEKEGEWITASVPRTQVDDPSQWIPREGEDACRRCLAALLPELCDRPFSSTRICWYADTPTANFLITYHPTKPSLFIATGGSGHGFKFLPVLGEKIVDAIEGRTPEAFRERWAWPRETVEVLSTDDGSRGDKRGMILDEEMKRGSRL